MQNGDYCLFLESEREPSCCLAFSTTAGIRVQRDPGQRRPPSGSHNSPGEKAGPADAQGSSGGAQFPALKALLGPPTSHHPSRGALRLSAPSRLGKGVVFHPQFSRKAQQPAQYHSVLARLEVLPPSL